MAQPVFKARDGALQLSVWANENNGDTFYSVDIKRSYKDSEDNWKETTSFTKRDLGALSMLSNLAFAKISELEAEQ